VKVKNSISNFKNKKIKDVRQASKFRSALFIFSLQKHFELDKKELRELLDSLGMKSALSFKALANMVAGGTRNLATETGYLKLDEILLSRIELNVFFGNFSDPKIVFSNPVDFFYSAEDNTHNFRGARITYLGVWESTQDDKYLSIDLAVEATFVLDVQSVVNLENPEQEEDELVLDQLSECRNMFNFSIKDFEYFDDDVLDHDWFATYLHEG